MINTFFIAGTIKKIQVRASKDPSKPESAVLLVQYGPGREASAGAVEFINAVQIRVPTFKYGQLKDVLQIERNVQINGHMQGVIRGPKGRDVHRVEVELIADKVSVTG